ncbi:MAG: hypothetical protein ABI598_06230 [Chloroflexota bacterium]
MAASRILLIASADDSLVADALRASGHETVSVSDVAGAIASDITENGTQVIVLDDSGAIASVAAACREIRSTTDLARIPILCVIASDDVEDRIELLEAGADDVIARPFDERELDARAEALALRFVRSRDLKNPGHVDTTIRDGSQRRIIGVFSPKGGAGTTTIAVNIATWLVAQLPGSVALLDLDLQFGMVATHLNLTPRVTLDGLLSDELTAGDPALFAAALDRHGSGLQVLGAPGTPDAAARLSPGDVTNILTTATAAFQIVVADLGSIMDARSEAAMAGVTDLVIVLTPEFPAIKAVHALSELLTARSNVGTEVYYVLNSIFARELLRFSDIEEALGTAVATTIPYDSFAFLKGVNEGIPIVQGAPRAAAAEELGRLAARLAGLPATSAQPRKSKGLGGLFGR